MNVSESKKFADLFESVSTSLGKLEELDRSYDVARADLRTELGSYLRQLAVLSDSQATRGQVVRELYWNAKIPAELIAEAFGLKSRAVRKVAGALILTLPCPNGCGNSVKREFASRSELDDYHREVHRSEKYSFQSHLSCDECKRKVEAEKEAEAARKRQRNAELRSMAWEDFIETEEWIEVRNLQVHYADYRCQLCHARGVGLYVYLAADTPQDALLASGSEYYVLCGDCVPKCAEHIGDGKGEYIKREFMVQIMDWNQER